MIYLRIRNNIDRTERHRQEEKKKKPDNDDDTNYQNNHTAGTKADPVSSFMQQREAGVDIHSSIE